MANKIFREMLQPQTHLNKNGFDNSYLHNFTAKIGELLPVACIETVPSGHYEIKVSDLMRTIPMNRPAFIRASQHFEFFFVPYKQLWHRWDDFYTSRSVPSSALNGAVGVPACTPVVPMGNALAQCKDSMDSTNQGTYYVHGDLGEYVGYGAQKIMNLLGYPNFKSLGVLNPQSIDESFVTAMNDFKPNAFRPAAYQKIFFDYYRQPFYDLPNNDSVFAYNLDDASDSTGALTELPYKIPGGRKHLRYMQLFQLHYRQYKKDLFTGVLPSTQFGAIAVVGNTATGLYGLRQQLELDVTGALESGSVDIDLSPISVGKGQSPNSNLVIGTNVTYPDKGVLMSNGSQFQIGNGLSWDDDIRIKNRTGDSAALNSTTLSGTTSGYTGANTVFFDILSLVKSQALQKWRETTLRSGFRNTSQYQGHFGVTPIFTEKDKCVFIDSVSSPLQVNSVTNTNAGAAIGGENIPLGDLGANGTSVVNSDKTIKFDAKDFGVIMCIYSVLPEVTYQHDGIALMNQKVLRDDFFTPEYENIGMQPITQIPLFVQVSNPTPVTLGYVPRYSEYKIGIDQQSNEFDDGSYDEGTAFVGAFAGWSPSRKFRPTSLSIGDFYVNPMYYRDIFTVAPWLPNEDSDEWPRLIGDSATDSFIHQCFFDIKSVLPMSVLGLPQY